MPDEGGWGFDSDVMRGLDAILPLSADDVHPDPILEAIVVVGTAAAGLAAAWFLFQRRPREALFLVASIGGTIALSSLTKVLVKRPAIEEPSGDSFPSGTAAWAAAVAAVAFLLVSSPRARGIVALAGAVLVVAYSALITWEEWHYASDVVAGWCLALAWVALLASLLLRGDARQGRSVAAVSGAGPWGRLRPSKSEARE